MDSHANNMPKPANKNGISNEWNFYRSRKTLVPNEDQFLRLIAEANGIPFVNLSPDDIEPTVAHLVTYELANRYTLIPLRA